MFLYRREYVERWSRELDDRFSSFGIRVGDAIGLGVEESDEDVFEEVRKSVSLP